MRFTRALTLAGILAGGLLAKRAGAQATPVRDTIRVAGDSAAADSALSVSINARLEAKAEQARNLACLPSQQFSAGAGCRGGFLTGMDVQGDVRIGGRVGSRLLVDVDFSSGREFGSSNVFSVRYQGLGQERLERVEVGTVDFATPASRFVTASLPTGAYGLQAIGRVGQMRLRAIAAQQDGNVVQTREFLIGDRTVAPMELEIEDYEIERLRFFFTVDPRLLRGFPNIDLLDRSQLARLRGSLPDTLRPARVLVYRLQYGAQPQNPNGPRFRLLGDPDGARQTYDLLREGVDYVIDPSQLWIALVRPLNPSNERLVVAYTVLVGGREVVHPTTGGTPDIAATTADQFANLVWDPNVGPGSPEFDREIRSVYRIAGDEIIRGATRLRIVTGSGDLERPLAGSARTFLEMFGVAQRNRDGLFDAENRLWPRPGDPVFLAGAGAGDALSGMGSRIIRDQFLIFPSARPFALRDSGLVDPGNPANPQIYTTPGEYLTSSQHPPSVYRLRVHLQSLGSPDNGSLALGGVQVRIGSERIVVDGRPLVRDRDYRVDYELGQVTFTRPDTLFTFRRRVEVRYEENPLFLTTPTTLFGAVGELPVRNGLLTFTGFRQQQTTAFTRPELGFQSAATLMGGVTGAFSWNLRGLTGAVARLPGGGTAAPSRLSVRGELAVSKPLVAGGQSEAFVESFESTAGGFTVSLFDNAWYLGSLPAYGRSLGARFGAGFFEPQRAAPIAWQTNATDLARRSIAVTIAGIDPLAALSGSFASVEPLLWLSLHPLSRGGRYDATTGADAWRIGGTPAGRRFRSIRTVLSASGADLSRGEFLEFWTLVDTTAGGRGANPTLVFDFGDLSENSVAFAPETLTVRRTGGAIDSLFTGRRLQGFDRLDGERDPFTRTFNAGANDVGLPGDRVERLVVIDGGLAAVATDVPICRGARTALRPLGDTRANCTVGNGRLEEEDIDLDGTLNFPSGRREQERLLRYIVDLSETSRIARLGHEYRDTVVVDGVRTPRLRRWALVRVPFRTPADSLNGVQSRRLRALRVTMVSGAGSSNDDIVQIPLARLRVTGAPWLKRSDRTLGGIAGERIDGGYVVVSTIGTADSSAALVYQSPPGVRNQSATRGAQFLPEAQQINEQSMRIVAGDLPLHHRAEAYYRFPSGEQNFMAFQQMRLWARGRGNGWGTGGELQMFVRIGRDADNFYLYRAPANSGTSAAAWEPEVRIDLARFFALRQRVERAYAAGTAQSVECDGIDAAIIAASGPPPTGRRYAACDDGYMVHTTDPAATPPNLAAVQEIAVGFVRVGAGGGTSPILPGDSLELWVDDIRLSRVVNAAGFAGELAVELVASDLGDLRLNITNRDPDFRQLAESPSFLNERVTALTSNLRLERLLPDRVNLALPLTITRTSTVGDPVFVQRTDIRARGLPALRTPEQTTTAYTLTVRRARRTGAEGTVVDDIVDNLSATTSWVDGGNRSEFVSGSSRAFGFTVDYLITSDSARERRLPWWLDRVLGAVPDPLRAGPVDALRATVFRLNPTQLRLTSGITTGDDRRVAFLRPVSTIDDRPRVNLAVTDLWRNAGSVELRPTPGMTVRWDAIAVRDFARYDGANGAAIAATNDRDRWLGAPVGFERERTVLGQLAFAPAVARWIRPRIDLSTHYAMVKDPNVVDPIRTGGLADLDSLVRAGGDPRDLTDPSALGLTLPRRIVATQSGGVGASFDLGRIAAAVARDSTMAPRIATWLAPVELRYDRSLLTAFDAATTQPTLGFQLGVAGAGSYRAMRGTLPSNAGRTGAWSATGALTLPRGLVLVNRLRHTTTSNWIRRFEIATDDALAEVQGEQTVFPDVALRWQRRPTDPDALIASLAASVGYTRSKALIALPGAVGSLAGLGALASPELRRSDITSLPFNADVSWNLGRMSTRGSYAITRRVDSLPGTINRSRGHEASGEVGRAFRVPAGWGLDLKNEVRLRAGLQRSRAETFVYGIGAGGGAVGRLQDNGRDAWNVAADTDLSETLAFTAQAARVVNFDDNINRRFAQTVISAILQIRFSGGK